MDRQTNCLKPYDVKHLKHGPRKCARRAIIESAHKRKECSFRQNVVDDRFRIQYFCQCYSSSPLVNNRKHRWVCGAQNRDSPECPTLDYPGPSDMGVSSRFIRKGKLTMRFYSVRLPVRPCPSRGWLLCHYCSRLSDNGFVADKLKSRPHGSTAPRPWGPISGNVRSKAAAL